MTTSEPTPFTINIEEAKLQYLKLKLDITRFPDELNGAGWDYGAPLEDIRRMVNRWKTSYDWREEEKRINDSMPQFTQNIEVDGHGSLKIHFVHKKSDVKDAIPILIVHGCEFKTPFLLFLFSQLDYRLGPGLFIEAIKLQDLLAVPDNKESPSFHVVALSLPGFGFSEATTKKGFAIPQFAEVGHKLMLSLGYNEYGMGNTSSVQKHTDASSSCTRR